MRGRGYFSPYADWEAFPNKKDKGNCTVVGKKSYKGWKFVYHKSRLDKIFAPSGRMLNFSYRNNKLTTAAKQITDYQHDKYGLLKSVSSRFARKPAERKIGYTYDEFDRVTKINYGNGQSKLFLYNQRGKLMKITANNDKSTKTVSSTYDIFDRLIKKIETSVKVDSISDPGIAKKSITRTKYAYTRTGKRCAMKITFPDGSIRLTKWKYDPFGRLLEMNDDGKIVIYEYSLKTALLAKQVINGIPVYYSYTKYNQLESKSLGEPLIACAVPTANRPSGSSRVSVPISYIKYFYAPDGSIVAREVSGIKQNYTYGWLDKVMSINQNDKVTAKYDYHINGQIATASVRADSISAPTVTSYEWDGLALIKRGTTNLTNEPAVTGGNPILATAENTKVLFNDMLGTTLGVIDCNGKKSFAPTSLTAFGEKSVKSAKSMDTFFTGKPHIEGLGYEFLFRNYRANLGEWQTADPLGYPNGWNNLAYCNNRVSMAIDPLGGEFDVTGSSDLTIL